MTDTQKLVRLLVAVEVLLKAKGRYNTQLAYEQLKEVFKQVKD